MSSRRTPRASIACTKCRLRKVRCDVAYRGHPCVNCKLDQEECVVQLRGRQSRLRLEVGVADQSSSNLTSASAPEAASRSEKDPKPKVARRPPRKKPTDSIPAPIPSSSTTATDIAFQAYPFIRSEFLSRLDQDEICYLDSQSCFRLPVASPWQGMLHAYFEHINPLVPVLDEAGFWRTVRGNGADSSSSSTLSLFVVQAILFAACPFASRRTIKECGFANCRKARAAFYRRAKLLYRLESELRPIEIIQGTLLLSLCSTAQTSSPVNSVWLSIAVQHARTLGVHHHSPVSQGTALPLDWLEVKRLWWVCLVRDRIIALAHRRPLQIVVDNWDAELELLSSREVSEAMCRSEVHSTPVRQGLFAAFVSVLRLCIPLTRILALGAALESANGNSFMELDLDLDIGQADTCAKSLRQWRDETKARFEMCYRAGTPVDSIAMHDHLLQIYYHSAYLHILNSKIKAAASHQKHALHAPDTLAGIGSAVETAIESIATSLSILAKQRLTQYIPNSIIMCAVPSVVLDAMYLKTTTTITTLNSAPAPTTERDSSATETKSNAARARIQTFYETTLALQIRYNNVHPVTDVITKVVDLLDGPNTAPSASVCASSDGPSALTAATPRACWNWNDLVASQPGYYLGVLRALDLVLSTGRAPAGPLGVAQSESGFMSMSKSVSVPPAPVPPPLPAVPNNDLSRDKSAGEGALIKPPSPAIEFEPNHVMAPLSPAPQQQLHTHTEPPSTGLRDAWNWNWNYDNDISNTDEGLALALARSNEQGEQSEQMTNFDLDADMASSRSSDPVLRDIFGLCRDLDVETLLSMV
ncbi:fungal-specific transcription factor domain-containing protein [Aspergillus carlsbadensis]|nr:fungal-specific transcription factor domain-containing protein [Aspergillus carlsbadensis]